MEGKAPQRWQPRLAAVAVRPEFGPTLPALLGARGVSRRAMIAGAAAVVLAAIGIVALARHLSHTRHLVVRAPLAFNFTYDNSLVHPAKPHPGELARLEGTSGPRRRVVITARVVSLPPFDGDLVGGYLPVHAERRLAELQAAYPGLQVTDEGKARTNDAPGYQIGFLVRTGTQPLRRLFGRDVYALPEQQGSRVGILISLRQYLRGATKPPDLDWIRSTRTISRSFTFGTSPA